MSVNECGRGAAGRERFFGWARPALAALAIIAALSTSARAARRPKQNEASPAPQEISVPPAAERAMAQIYAGDPGAALAAARQMEKKRPDDPLGYLIEAEARWWGFYCEQSELAYGMVDFWKLSPGADGQPYLAATGRAVGLGEQELQKGETARAHLWTGMGYALEARMYAVQGVKMATARAGVKAREHLLRALELDPALADANSGLGLYNYYVSTLSPIVKVLRIFLGIPGGSKQQGVEQLRTAMAQGRLTSIEARFYLAKNLRTYDHDYAEALRVAEPLARQYPHNPIFLLLVGNLELELGRREQAEAVLARIEQLKIPDAACREKSRQMAKDLLGAK
ncbi:MAG TPA: tetratricopeptide repeat protein [Candidatus Dormibacteraeota bacterium]|nr:tetratricopeptide repeat protein [Candidatus Dormibacteraeota bacterium]